MSTFGGIQRAYSGIYAHRRRIDVIGENIANVDTPGYHRQRVDLSPVEGLAQGVFTGTLDTSGGVAVNGVDRMRDVLLENHARNQSGVAADRSMTADVLQQLEGVIGGLDEGGLKDQVTALFNSFDDLASAPDDGALRRVVLQRAETVAQGFTRTATAIDQLRLRTHEQTIDAVRTVNNLTQEIADLNLTIASAVNSDSDPNELLDQRDVKIAELATLADVRVSEGNDGQVMVSLDGQSLVSNGTASQISLQAQADPGLAAIGYDKIVAVAPDGRELTIRSGELAADLSALASTVPSGRIALDAVAADLTSQINTIHQAGSGLDASTGLDFFEHDTLTGALSVSTDVEDNPDGIAAAGGGAGPLDNATARELAHLAEKPGGPLTVFTEMVGSLAAQVGTASSNASAADAASAFASNLALSASGVSVDEELTDLITAQRSYESSARLMTAIDEMLQILINSTGLVGR